MDQILQIISERLGIRIGDKDAVRLRTMLTERSRHVAQGELPRYAQFLQGGGRESEQEWDELASLLTTGETYFFRDNGQIKLLRTQVLPDLIKQRGASRSLRIWSAGCSSGEEAYSLAMLLDELLPLRQNWNITILGTDVDHRALAKAENSVYTDWSFRNMDAAVRTRYFRHDEQGWRLDERIKNLVSFQRMNLLTDPIPSATASEMDLIICRNVFIYFEPEHIASVFDKLAASLRDGGYLLTGHGELQGVDTRCLKRHVFAESIVHQKCAGAAATVATRPTATRPTATRPTATRPTATARMVNQRAAIPLSADVVVDSNRRGSTSCDEIDKLLRDGLARAAMERAEALALEDPDNVSVLTLLARAHADLGNHREAAAFCERAMNNDHFAIAPHYLLAKVAEAEGSYDHAKSHLKRVLYLDPYHLLACLDLAELFDGEGDVQQARKHRAAAIKLLESWPADEPVEGHGPQTARELSEHLHRLVNDA